MDRAARAAAAPAEASGAQAARDSRAPRESARATRALESLERVRDSAAAARASVVAADQKLAQLLAALGPALLREQKEVFIRTYRRRHQDAYAAEATATKALAVALENSTLPRDAILRGYAVLATTSRAEDALRWASQVAASGSSFSAGLDPDLVNVAAVAAENAATSLVTGAKSPADGLQRVQSLLQPFVFADVQRVRMQVLLGIGEQLARGDFKAMAGLVNAEITDHPITRALAVAVMVSAGAQALDEARKGAFVEALRDLARTGGAGLGLVASATRSLGNAAAAAQLAGDASRLTAVTTLASRFSSGLWAVASLSSLAVRTSDTDKNAGTYLSMAGDLVACAGCALAATGVGVAAQPFVFGIGIALGVGGESLSSSIREKALATEARAMLDQANAELRRRHLPEIPAALVTVLGTPGAHISRLAPLDLSPQQLQAVLVAFPELATMARARAQDLIDVVHTLALRPEEVGAFLAASRLTYGTLHEASLMLSERRAGFLQSLWHDPQLSAKRANLRRTIDDPDQVALALQELTRETNARNTAAWASEVRALLHLPAVAARP
jgi:hypothetical protein